MPITLDSADRKLLGVTGGALVLLFAIALFLTPGGYVNQGYPSTWSDASDGGRAALLMLQAAGYQVQQWRRAPAALPLDAQHGIMILAMPFRPMTDQDRAAVKRWLTRGGSVLAIGVRAAWLLPENDAVSTFGPSQHLNWHAVPAILPGPLTQGAPVIHTSTPYVWVARHPAHVKLYADKSGAVVVWYRYGAGNVIWWADPTPLTNAGLSQPGNLELLLNSLSVAGSRQQVHIYWDEYFHTMPAGFWSTLAIAPFWGGLTQLGLIFLFILWTYARRRGPVWQPVPAGRLAPMEYVETMAALYRRTKAASIAVEVAMERFRARVTRRLGLDSRTPDRVLAHAAARQLRRDPAETVTLISQCEQALTAKIRPETALVIVQKLHDQTARLENVHGEPVIQGE